MTTDWAGEEIEEDEGELIQVLDWELPFLRDAKRPFWQQHAVCREMTDLFFPALYEQPAATEMREWQAKGVCARCPVKIQCRDFGRANAEQGIWGGENDQDRAALGIFNTQGPSCQRRHRNN